MIRCSKCELLKEDDKFYTYWHSTQQKFRTRKICTECTTKQNNEYKKKMKDPSNNPNYKKCRKCEKYVTLDRICKANKSTCYDCWNEFQRNKQKKLMLEKGGSDRVSVYPDHYTCQIQKEQVFMVMEALGWTYDNGIWFKEGIKTRDGVFVKYQDKLLEKQKEVKKQEKKEFMMVNKRPSRARLILVENQDEILNLRKKGMYYYELAEMFNISECTIRRFVDECYEKKND